MVYVKLESDWTDGDGVAHSAGESVDVDAATLAALQADGIVSERSSGGGPRLGRPDTSWAGRAAPASEAAPTRAGVASPARRVRLSGRSCRRGGAARPGR